MFCSSLVKTWSRHIAAQTARLSAPKSDAGSNGQKKLRPARMTRRCSFFLLGLACNPRKLNAASRRPRRSHQPNGVLGQFDPPSSYANRSFSALFGRRKPDAAQATNVPIRFERPPDGARSRPQRTDALISAGSQQSNAKPMQMRHQAVDHDRHRDGCEEEGAGYRRHCSEPAAERDVDDGERWEDAEPDHQCELMLARRRNLRTVV